MLDHLQFASAAMSDQTAFYKEVGKLIHKARRRGHFTQQQLADSVDLTRTSITNIERGRQKLLLHTLIDISRALKVSPSVLLPIEAENHDSELERKLRKHPESERVWITATLNVAKKETTV
jgi:transcriptional regulator with XRE-family HTH domain